MDIIIGEMYFEPHGEDDNNLEDTSKEKALSIFKEVQDITDMYHIVVIFLIGFKIHFSNNDEIGRAHV